MEKKKAYLTYFTGLLLFVAISGIAMATDWLLLFEAYAQIGVSLGMLINYTGPAIVIAASPENEHSQDTM